MFAGGAACPTATRTGTCRADRTNRLWLAKAAGVSTTMRVATRGPGGRAVSSGSSSVAVRRTDHDGIHAPAKFMYDCATPR